MVDVGFITRRTHASVLLREVFVLDAFDVPSVIILIVLWNSLCKVCFPLVRYGDETLGISEADKLCFKNNATS